MIKAVPEVDLVKVRRLKKKKNEKVFQTVLLFSLFFFLPTYQFMYAVTNSLLKSCSVCKMIPNNSKQRVFCAKKNNDIWQKCGASKNWKNLMFFIFCIISSNISTSNIFESSTSSGIISRSTNSIWQQLQLQQPNQQLCTQK